MHDVSLLTHLGVALAAAFCGGLVARRLKLPTIVGYLLAGVIIGPFTPGFVGDLAIISQLAELGIIFLMFGVGLHFSLRDLWQVRDIAVPGAIGQMAIMTILGLGLSHLWGWSTGAGLVLGLAISIASTVVLLRALMDNGLLDSPHGRVAVGWLVLEDLATVVILVVIPGLPLAGAGLDYAGLAWTLLKAGAFVGLMLLVGVRLVPWLLQHTAHLRSRELFILLVLTVALGTALGSAAIFGVSLALGAFVAGVVVSESPLSHQVGVDVVPFREAFAVLFFVSVGMLVDPRYIWANLGHVAALIALIVVGKALIGAGLASLFPHPARTALVVGAGLSQIGEFSFIVGQVGLAVGLLNQDQYALILAGALFSITLNPVMFRLIRPAEHLLRRYPAVWRLVNQHGPAAVPAGQPLTGHVVVVGYGRVGHHIVDVLGQLAIPRLVVEVDAERALALRANGVPSLFGDAANSDLLDHAGLGRARALVVSVPDDASAQLIVAAARRRAARLPIIARAATREGIARLSELGADDVIHPEFEGGLATVRAALLRLDLPLREVQRYTDVVRHERYDIAINTEDEHRVLQKLMDAANAIDITWLKVGPDSPLVGQTLAQADLRSQTGASVVALFRDGQVLPNPKSMTVFQPGDRVGLIGEPEHITAAERRLSTAMSHGRDPAADDSPPAV